MKSRQIFLVLFACSLALLSCRPSQQRSGGSVVGNGMIRFYNPFYNYSFGYDARLTLTQLSKEIVIVEDRDLAVPKGLPVSTTKFEVLAVSDMSQNDLLSYAEGQYPGYIWQSTEKAGTPGLYYKSEGPSPNAEYLFLLGTSSLLHVHIDLSSSEEGAKLIENVVESLTIDIDSPLIHKVFFDPPTLRAGEIAKLKIHATDNMGVIRARGFNGSISGSHYNACHSLVREDNLESPWFSPVVMNACGDFRSLGNDWYEIAFPVHSRARPGTYHLGQLSLWDNAGNSASMTKLLGNDYPELEETHAGVSQIRRAAKFVSLKIENDAPDIQAPILKNVRFEPAVLSAGETGKLVFDVSDDDPEFAVKFNIHPLSFWASNMDADQSRFASNALVSQPFDFPAPRQRKDQSWELDFKSDEHMRPGRYSISFDIKDSASNETTAEAKLIVVNDRIIDAEGPRLLEIRPLKSQYKRGETVTIMIRAQDDFSGVVLGGWKIENVCWNGLRLHSANIFDGEDSNSLRSIPLCMKQFRHVDGDWYAIEFNLSENIQTGEYRLPELVLSDRLGNITSFESDFAGLPGAREVYVDSSRQRAATGSEVVSIQVTR